MSNERKIKYVLDEGHKIAGAINDASDVSDVEKIEPEIDSYAAFVDEDFGSIDDFDDTKNSDLSTMLYVAYNWKRDAFKNPSASDLADDYLRRFKEYLDSKEWVG